VSYVYFVKALPDGPIKIGKALVPFARLSELQVGNHCELALLGVILGDETTERALHEQLAEHRVRGEWFEDTPELQQAMDRAGVERPYRPERGDGFPALVRAPGVTAAAFVRGGGQCENCSVPLRHREHRICQACREFEDIRAIGGDPFAEDEPQQIGFRRRGQANRDAISESEVA